MLAIKQTFASLHFKSGKAFSGKTDGQYNQRAMAASLLYSMTSLVFMLSSVSLPQFTEAYISVPAIFIRRPRGPPLRARTRLTSRSHQVPPRICLRSRHRSPVTCSCSDLRPLVTRLLRWDMARTRNGCFSFQAKQREKQAF